MRDTDASVNDSDELTADDYDTDSYVEPTPAPRRQVGRKLPALTGHTLGDVDRVEFDFLLAQHPPRARGGIRVPERFPGKRFAVDADGRKAKVPYNLSGWFRSWFYAVHDIDSLHEAFERVRTCVDSDGEPGYVVCGDLDGNASPAAAPRSKHATVTAAGQRKPRGLVDARRWWLVLDVDKVSNPGGLDPRKDAASRQAIIDFLRSLLPDELRYAAVSWQMSSSTCVFGPEGLPLPADQPPARLGAHLRFWLDTGLDEGERRLLLQRLSHYVRLQLEARGLEPLSGAGVDPATATFNQAIFVCASFETGLQDPLPVRSGLSSGTPEVLVGVLDEQLPQLPAVVKAARKLATKEEKQAAADRRAHDRLLRDATRERAPAPRPRPATPAADPVPGVRLRQRARSEGPQHRVLHQSRIGKLADIVTLTDDRRTRLPEWRYGIPEGMRRRTMLVVSGLLSHLVPVWELPRAIATYGNHLTSPEWMATEWDATKQAAGILRKAAAAESEEQFGRDGSGLREDPWLERVMALMQPTHDEMVGLRLRALRTDAARKEVKRRDAGKLTEEERRELRATSSEAARKPWEADGVSEATWRRRKRAARQQAIVTATEPATARLTERGLQDVLAYLRVMRQAEGYADALHQLAAGPLSAISATLEEFGPDLFLPRLQTRAQAYHSAGMRDAALIVAGLHDAWAEDGDIPGVLRWILTSMPGYLAWSHEHDAGEKVYAVSEVLALAEQHPTYAVFMKAVLAVRETPVTVEASVYQGMDPSVGGGGQTQAWPGAQAAGCSRATWFRRLAAANGKPQKRVSSKPPVAVAAPQVLMPFTGDWNDEVPF